jgi:CBS domain-containing protein
LEIPAHDAVRVPAIGQTESITELDALDDYPKQIVELTRARLDAGEDALTVSGAIGDTNDVLTRRLLSLAEAHLGPPPRPYVWLALGSHGRREQVLSSDQDSAIAYAAPGESAESDAAITYFTELAELIVSALARAGMPLCDGGYMATNWHRPLDEYARVFRDWVERPEPEALLKAEVFLDVRACHGDLSPEPLERILLTGGSRGPFRAQMARAALTFKPPLGWFGRLRTHESTLDVKRGGTAAIVLLARLYALIAGAIEHSTVPRLRAAAAAGTLNASNATDLVEAYGLLTDLRLRHQLEQADEGAVTDNLVPIERIPKDVRSSVRSALRVIREIQEVTALRFATHAVT